MTLARASRQLPTVPASLNALVEGVVRLGPALARDTSALFLGSPTGAVVFLLHLVWTRLLPCTLGSPLFSSLVRFCSPWLPSAMMRRR